MDYDRTHQSHLESKYKAQKQNGTFLSFHPLCMILNTVQSSTNSNSLSSSASAS